MLDSRADTSPDVAAAGMLINTMGYIDDLGYELLVHAITTLRVSLQHVVTCWPLAITIGVWLVLGNKWQQA